MKKNISVKKILISYYSLVFVLVVLYGIYSYRQYKKEEAQALQGISERTGVPADWLSVREYVYCDLLKPGMSFDEVQIGLALIGEISNPVKRPSQIVDYFDQRVDFISPSINNNLSPIKIIYDENGRVELFGGGEFNHGPRSSCELERGQNAQKTRTAEAYPIDE